MRTYMVLIAMLLLFKMADGVGWFFEDGYYDGPEFCGAVVSSLKEVFTEYPESIGTQVNFLEMLDPCNHVAEEEFVLEMRTAYSEARITGATQYDTKNKLGSIWEKWRAHTVWGKYEGNRICNPRRLLSCHESLSRCVCRQNFAFSDATKNRHYSRIQTSEVLQVNQWKGESWNTETVKACQVKPNGVCDWQIPWFGYCNLPCAGKNMTCVGQPEVGSRGPKICRQCFAPEGIAKDGCTRKVQKGAAVSIYPWGFKMAYFLSAVLIQSALYAY